LYATQDNGCLYFFRYWDPSFGGYDEINKIGPNGNHQWTNTYNWPMPQVPLNYFYYLPTLNNTYLIRTNDTLKETDLLGNILGTRLNFNGGIAALPDSDFIHTDTSYIFRENISGVQKWNAYAPGVNMVSTNLFNTYVSDGNYVMKINTNDGHVNWTKLISCKNLLATSDSGFITLRNSSNGITEIVKYDSSGAMQWTKSHFMPRFGYHQIAESNAQSYVTGGCWQNISMNQAVRDYSPFMVKIDRNSEGTIDTSNFYFWGNANDNNHVSFGDDAVYVAASFNNSGPVRDSILKGNHWEENIYGIDWPDSFAVGINYKYPDVDGNGTIDTNDLVVLPHQAYNVTPHWRTPANYSNLPELKIVFESDSLILNDTIKIDVILGSSTQAIDSIYGISFDILLYNIGNNYGHYSSYSIKPSALGDTSINLYTHFYSEQFQPILSMVLCRTDHMNAYLTADTIVSFQLVFDDSTFFWGPISMLVDYSAITANGFPVTLQDVFDTLTYFSTTNILHPANLSLSVYPQPADNMLIFDSDKSEIQSLKIWNSNGQLKNILENTGKILFLNVKDYPDGIYFYGAISGGKHKRGKFVVLH
jgi:hypothetical protein